MRAANMQALTNDVKQRFPGVVVYGVGDEAHKLSPSDHNEDDTKGSRPEQTDSDSVPEHRAIDIMVTGDFTEAEAEALVARMVADAPTQKRLNYIIWEDKIWSRSSGWSLQPHYGEYHSHVHVSGWAPDDENSASWPIVFAQSTPPEEAGSLRRPWPSYVPQSEYFGDVNGPNESHGGYYPQERADVKAIQIRMQELGFAPSDPGWADGVWEQPTTDAVAAWQRRDWSHTTTLYGQVWYDDWYHLFTY